jgi:hypothetical protein
MKDLIPDRFPGGSGTAFQADAYIDEAVDSAERTPAHLVITCTYPTLTAEVTNIWHLVSY